MPCVSGLDLLDLKRSTETEAGVEKGVLYLSGLDLIDRTPILDVKPYVPASDSIPPPQEQLKYYVRELEFYDTYEEAWAAIREHHDLAVTVPGSSQRHPVPPHASNCPRFLLLRLRLRRRSLLRFLLRTQLPL
eukprot:1082224-Rhodomonas_salina.2